MFEPESDWICRAYDVLIIITRSVARFARPLLACACISFVYILHGRLLLSYKARYSNRPSLIINHVFDVIDDLVPTSAIFSISQPKNSLTAEPFLTCNDGKEEATERIFSLHYAFMCRSGTQVELPRRLAMSQVGLVDDHTLHQPCVQSLSFKSTLALWMPAHWTPSLWPTVAIPQRKK